MAIETKVQVASHVATKPCKQLSKWLFKQGTLPDYSALHNRPAHPEHFKFISQALSQLY